MNSPCSVRRARRELSRRTSERTIRGPSSSLSFARLSLSATYAFVLASHCAGTPSRSRRSAPSRWTFATQLLAALCQARLLRLVHARPQRQVLQFLRLSLPPVVLQDGQVRRLSHRRPVSLTVTSRPRSKSRSGGGDKIATHRKDSSLRHTFYVAAPFAAAASSFLLAFLSPSFPCYYFVSVKS